MNPLPYLLLSLSLFGALSTSLRADDASVDYEQALQVAKRTENKVYRASFEPHWLPDKHDFGYRIQTGTAKWEYVRVNAETGVVQRAADTASLGLPEQTFHTTTEATLAVHPSRKNGAATRIRLINHTTDGVDVFWVDLEGHRQAYGRVKPNEEREQSTFAGHVWLLTDPMGATLAIFEAKSEPLDMVIDGKGRAPTQAEQPGSNMSPDGKWFVEFAGDNVALKDRATGESIVLTSGGTTARPYRGPVAWAPDSRSVVVLLVKQAEPRKMVTVESSPADQEQPKVRALVYQKPGDELPKPQPVLIRLADKKPQLIAEDLSPNPFTPGGRVEIRWSPRSDEFYYDYNQRAHQLYRIIGVNAATGNARVVVEETSKTFIDYTQKTWRHWLDKTGEMLWMSERDGWCHLWLYDVTNGAVKGQVTRGKWVVRNVERVDEEKRQVWFLASGLRDGEDPYQLHLCRANFDGTGFLQLTQGDGNHEIEFSPDGRFFIARWSRVDQPPVAELRQSDNGRLICELERADAGALLAAGWTMPERFVAKGRDGQTDIYGVLIKPSHFDPARRYPILEEVYAGPHGAFAPKTFDRLLRQHTLAELGFIVVKVDGMGTNHRGKAFHDVCWKNLADAGFPDRIAWIKAAAATRPWMDLGRVGIFGGSAGGANAMRALLDHHDFYRAAFADCGCHDNRMDKIWWNEQWLGWPVDEAYVRNSNVADAGRLQGHLMLCVGELDQNVDPATTMQVVNALEKANKDFELLIMTNTGHGAAETPYASRRRMEFFVRHLMDAPALPHE